MESANWVFGYGSLIWRQDFPFLDARRASIDGWSRRFWQGSHDHRGVADDPGRVVTLVQSPSERCVGRAFLVNAGVFGHLDHREKNGYIRHRVKIRMDAGDVDGVTYIARSDNVAFLGPAPIADMVRQIRRCHGPSGRNRDYVIELDRALRQLGTEDPHVALIASMLMAARSGTCKG